MRRKRWDIQSLLMQASPGRSHVHHSQKNFFHKTSSLLSVPHPGEPTDLIKLASPSARDIVLAVLERGKHHHHLYLSRSHTGHRHEQPSHPASVTLPLHQSVRWWFLQKGHTVLGTAVLGKPLLFLAILLSYTLGWEPACGDPAILGPQTQRGL